MTQPAPMQAFLQFMESHCTPDNRDLLADIFIATTPLWEASLGDAKYPFAAFNDSEARALKVLAEITGGPVARFKRLSLARPLPAWISADARATALQQIFRQGLIGEAFSAAARKKFREPLRQQLGPLHAALTETLWTHLGPHLGSSLGAHLDDAPWTVLDQISREEMWKMLSGPFRTSLLYLYGFGLAGDDRVARLFLELISFFNRIIPLGAHPDEPMTYIIAIS